MKAFFCPVVLAAASSSVLAQEDAAAVRTGLLPSFCLEHPLVKIPADYDPKTAPGAGVVVDGDVPARVPVTSSNFVADVTQVDDHRRVVTMTVVSLKQWRDDRIQVLGANATTVTTAIALDEDFFLRCLWSPTLMFDGLDSVEGWGDLVKEPKIYAVQMSPKGPPAMSYTSYNKLSVSCVFDFNNYPFDTQVCDVLEMSFGVAGNWIRILGLVVHNEEKQRELQYEVRVEESPVREKNFFNRSLSSYGWRITLKRRIGTHVMQTYVPTSLFVVASWISFLIPPEIVPGRMTLLVTLLLVQVNIFLTVAEEVPRTPRMSSLNLWCLSCIAILMAGVIQYGVVLYQMHFNRSHLSRGKTKTAVGDVVKSAGGKEDEEEGLRRREREQRQVHLQRMDMTSFVLFPMTSTLLAAVYWIYHLQQQM